MPRYKIIVEYDGAPFAGWQYQDNSPSVQRAIMTAIEAFSGEKVMVQGAGRTDAGVHALGQVAHFDLASDRETDTVRDAINAHLRPLPVAILSAEKVPGDFDARRSAVRRHYLYRIANRRPDLAIERGRAWRIPRRLDVSRAGDEIHISAVARSFLHNQVRSMVGSLVPVGDGKWQAADLARALEARDRSACGPVAPPDGLYLVKVDY